MHQNFVFHASTMLFTWADNYFNQFKLQVVTDDLSPVHLWWQLTLVLTNGKSDWIQIGDSTTPIVALHPQQLSPPPQQQPLPPTPSAPPSTTIKVHRCGLPQRLAVLSVLVVSLSPVVCAIKHHAWSPLSTRNEPRCEAGCFMSYKGLGATSSPFLT